MSHVIFTCERSGYQIQFHDEIYFTCALCKHDFDLEGAFGLSMIIDAPELEDCVSVQICDECINKLAAYGLKHFAE